MKDLFKNTFIAVLMLVITMIMMTCTPAHAQGWTTYNADDIYSDGDAGKSVRFQGVIDSTLTTYVSAAFQLSGYQGESFTTYPVHYRYRHVSAAGTPYVTHIIQGNMGDSTWINIDTLCVRDSTEANQRGTIDFNGVKCHAYRLSSAGGTSGNGGKNRSDTVAEVTFYVPRKDPE
ncbi:hypothetical protein [Zoogloea sp.]|uniref:hypothetical protein n=1 Tax=Zoogloea sp. TaxID=49181 RepID=UPI001415BD59|nr:MAG: hypothetical protein F9K15_12750 [Zoogloea sp.]